MKNYENIFDLTGKTAIVTGGAGVLGKHFCIALSNFGANVAVVDLYEDSLNKVITEIKKNSKSTIKGFVCDITNKESVDLMVSAVLEEFGKIDILHNNAAGKSDDLSKFFEKFEYYELSQWNKIMDVNVNGMFLVAQAVGSSMVNNNVKGSIIQTSSIYGIMGPDQRIYDGSDYLGHQINTPAVYSTSKAAVIGLTKYLATYWANKGIRVNTLTPGGVESGQNDQFKHNYSLRVPLGRMASTDEMVGALIFLASDASSYITGQNIVIDGGLSAW
jgi:NAD(P)-dependent dehydrogenase (short-subunit alcohol dehydrogenase family)